MSTADEMRALAMTDQEHAAIRDEYDGIDLGMPDCPYADPCEYHQGTHDGVLRVVDDLIAMTDALAEDDPSPSLALVTARLEAWERVAKGMQPPSGWWGAERDA